MGGFLGGFYKLIGEGFCTLPYAVLDSVVILLKSTAY
jgi:hypothetical protein